MIKKKLTYAATKGLFLLSAFSFLLSSCSQEEDFAPQGGNDEIRISFTSDAIQTRVNTLGTGDKWENGDQVKIERTNKYDSDYYTYTASVAENGTPTWTLDKKLYWNGEEEHILAAFYQIGRAHV